jgi:hypothetical protein
MIDAALLVLLLGVVLLALRGASRLVAARSGKDDHNPSAVTGSNRLPILASSHQ